jgi:hypothetical protein
MEAAGKTFCALAVLLHAESPVVCHRGKRRRRMRHWAALSCFAQVQGGRHWPPVQRMRCPPVLHAPENLHAFRFTCAATTNFARHPAWSLELVPARIFGSFSLMDPPGPSARGRSGGEISNCIRPASLQTACQGIHPGRAVCYSGSFILCKNAL